MANRLRGDSLSALLWVAAAAAIGGAVGAIGMALLCWSQIARSLVEIEAVLNRPTISRRTIRLALERFAREVGMFRTAVYRLKEFLRIP